MQALSCPFTATSASIRLWLEESCRRQLKGKLPRGEPASVPLPRWVQVLPVPSPSVTSSPLCCDTFLLGEGSVLTAWKEAGGCLCCLLLLLALPFLPSILMGPVTRAAVPSPGGDIVHLGDVCVRSREAFDFSSGWMLFE